MGNEIRNEFTIIWRIENFSLRCHDSYEWVDILECTAENLEKSRFYLKLYCTSMKPLDEKCLSIKLSYVDDDTDYVVYDTDDDDDDTDDDVDDGGRHLPMECTMEIADASGETLQSKRFERAAEEDRILFRWENIMSVNELFNEMKNRRSNTLTVRCHIHGKVQTRQASIECAAMTKFGFDRCSLLWKVEMPNTSDWSASETFHFLNKPLVTVTLSVPEDDVIINIKLRTSGLLPVACSMSLLDIRGHERYSQFANFRLRADAVWKFPTFFTKTMLKDNKRTLLSYDTFTLACNFSVLNFIDFKEVRYRTLPLVNTPFTEDSVSSLLDDWRNMLTSKKHADVKLRVDNEIFPAHKSLLAARSPIFSAMFDQDMLESRTGIVDIEDFDVKTMNSFLEFLYTGKVDDMDYENASKLLIAAEKYQVLSLKEKCASFLMPILSEENVCQILNLADMVGHELLKASTLDYIKSHARNILRSPLWLKWSEKNIKLATEIICVLSTDITSGK